VPMKVISKAESNVFNNADDKEMNIIKSDFKGFIKNNEVRYTPRKK